MPNRVVSKYFSSESETGMDDSLSDFQKKKKIRSGPKNVKKTRITKKLKSTRGQKDIRALINKKENDVISYSKDFDKVCKQTGVDVDPEELQLAIALSKSLNEVKTENSSETLNKCLTTQERTLKIKTTLQEYGFRVPKRKITDPNRRKKYRKQYKLLLISDKERQQIISDKYSEVIAGHIFKSPAKVFDCDYSDKELYYKTTNIAYEYIKNDDVYYVKDLFDKPEHKTCLLRDWSEIPGRPLSPTVEFSNVKFDDIIFDQHDLDCLLSGSIVTAQQVINNKILDTAYNNSIHNTIQLQFDESEPLKSEVRHEDDNISGIKIFKETKCDTYSNTMNVSQVRCISPDLFDEEASILSECTDTDINVPVSEQIVSMTDNNHIECMELTECVNVDYNLHAKINGFASNKINITNRNSNDFMEITECVPTNSKQLGVEKIYLTHNLNVSNNQTGKLFSQNESIDVMDLTQDCGAPEVKPCHTIKDKNDTILIVDDDLSFKLHYQKQHVILKEISVPSCIDNMTNFQQNYDIGDTAECPNTDINDCKTKNIKNSHNIYSSCEKVETVTLDDENNSKKTTKKIKYESSSKKGNDYNFQITTNSFTDQVYNNSYESNWKYEEHLLKNIDVGSNDHKNELVECHPDEIDLTQSSNSSQGETINNLPISNYASLGKKDNISIDYDEIDNDIVIENFQTSFKLENHRNKRDSTKNKINMSNTAIISNPTKNSELNFFVDQSKLDNFDIRDITITEDKNSSSGKEPNIANNDLVSNSSKSSEIFEISDKEFNYSLYQSKHNNDFDCVSVNNDLPTLESKCSECTHDFGIVNRSGTEKILNNSYTMTKLHNFSLNLNSETSTSIVPNKDVNNKLLTPKNSEYIIKTNEVTPMLDYASMSSPERHKELEKYGLKPFKRKRAIKLLTYLYNQTHPIVELHNDECPLPSKRQKKDNGDTINYLSKKPSKSAPLESVIMTSQASPKYLTPVENKIYALTSEQPDIRNIECEADELFFQKREKAKLHSCRIPLHVAFHNYVTCRSRLREAILRYEPVDIDFIHKDLVATGYRYQPKDLLKFMDRKCITVRTADNNTRNRKS